MFLLSYSSDFFSISHAQVKFSDSLKRSCMDGAADHWDLGECSLDATLHISEFCLE